MSSSNINFINRISLHIYNILYENTQHSYFINNLKGILKFKNIIIIIKDDIYNTILWNSKYLYNAKDKKILIIDNKLVFNPVKGKNFVSNFDLTHLSPLTSDFGEIFSPTIIKNTEVYIPHAMLKDGIVETYKKYSTPIIYTHWPLQDRIDIKIDITDNRKQFLVYNVWVDNSLMKESSKDYLDLKLFDKGVVEEHQMNALLWRCRNGSAAQVQSFGNTKFKVLQGNYFFDSIYNARNEEIYKMDYFTYIQFETIMNIIEKRKYDIIDLNKINPYFIRKEEEIYKWTQNIKNEFDLNMKDVIYNPDY